jgi:O-Antigen ligase
LIARNTALSPALASLPMSAAPLRERLLLFVLFVTVFASSIAFIEPSPHDALMGVLAVAALIGGMRFERILVVPFLLLLIWNVSGLISLLNVVDQEKTIQYAGTSVYLALAAIMFACLFTQNTMPRLVAMRTAYVMTAVLSALLGAAGYFHLFPGAESMFTLYGRAMGAFKDPNVYGPFLIWPALFLVDRMVGRRIYLSDSIVATILLVALLLSFSRGAWFNFSVGCAIVMALVFLTAPTPRERWRVLILSGAAIAAFILIVVFLLSFHSLGQMFDTRAQLIQSYDVGQGGRFRLQELALNSVLSFPNGMGPLEFARVNGLQQHNVYLQAFLVYGWVGGMAYLLLLFSTVIVGLRTALVRTPWQPYLITAVAAFIGDTAEGFVIDTDHWRYFYLLLGLIWGLAATTFRQVRASGAATTSAPSNSGMVRKPATAT